MAVRSSEASTQPHALEERVRAAESCRIQKWLFPSLESHGKTKSPEKTGKKCHGDLEDVSSTDCIAAKDEEGRGGVCPPHQTQTPQWGNQVIPQDEKVNRKDSLTQPNRGELSMGSRDLGNRGKGPLEGREVEGERTEHFPHPQTPVYIKQWGEVAP